MKQKNYTDIAMTSQSPTMVRLLMGRLLALRDIDWIVISTHPFPPSSSLLMLFRVWHSTIGSVSLDGLTLQRLLVQVPENQFQMLTITFRIAERQNTNRKFKNIHLRNAGAGITKHNCWSRVHSQSRNFANGVPAGRRDARYTSVHDVSYRDETVDQ